jgi:hypothetical protein
MAPYNEDGEYFVGAKKRRQFREMMIRDLEEMGDEMEKNNQAVDGKEAKAQSAKGDLTSEGKAKKRRRLRKQSRQKDEAVMVDTTINDKEALDSTSNSDGRNASAESALPSKKRKRRRKSVENEEKISNIDRAVASDIVISTADSNSSKIEDALARNEKQSKAKRSSKKHRKKRSKVEGVSDTRLASYGL